MSVRSDKMSRWIVAGTMVLVVGVITTVIMTLSEDRVIVRIGDGAFRTTIASSLVEREQGLSGRSQLGSSEALMLVYEEDSRWQIWMKDMNFPIDIVWLDSEKKVIYIAKNVQPESYPEIFSSNDPARYVLEVPAGSVDSRNIRLGSKAQFNLEQRVGLFN